MIRRNHDHMKMPLFFKLWFAFIATLVLCVFGAVGWTFFQVVQAGPEGLAKVVGSAVRAYHEEAR
jgi:hypothetical protein